MSQNYHEFDTKMMRLALELASIGVGRVSPSPPVGCVIVSAAGEIVGEGTYLYENVTHAEVLALEQAGHLAEGGTAYVSLEPHSYQGRTKPCTEALIKAKIKRVVCPIEDPNPLVSGTGFEILRANRIEVETGILRDEAARLIEKFCVWHREKRPFFHLKTAMSLDGRIALKKNVSTAITGAESSRRVHELRYENDAILTGGMTAVIDNPQLTDRSGKPRRRPLVRIVLDNRLQIAENSVLVETANETPTLIISNSSDQEKSARLQLKGVEIAEIDARDLQAVAAELRRRDLQGVLIEGGAEIAGALCDSDLVDKISYFVAPMIFGGHDAPVAIGGRGAESLAQTLRLKDLAILRHGADLEITAYPDRK